jgi:uncharacterized repeat protein (TIGR01451 family)
MRSIFKLLSLLTVATVAALMVAPFSSGAAQHTLNGDPRDYLNLRIAAAGGSYGTNTAVTAKEGDVFSIILWDHHSDPVGSPVLENVRAHISVPSTEGTEHTISSTLTGDGANTARGTVRISTANNTQVSYIPGSATFYKNVADKMTASAFPSTVSNKDAIVGSGLNLGSQAACWEFAQAIVIQVKVTGTHPDVHIRKEVALFNGTPYSNAVTANPGDTVVFQVFVQNTGTGVGRTPTITDVLDSGLQYVSGSSKYYAKVNNQDTGKIAIPESNIIKNGQTVTWKGFSDMLPEPNAALYLVFQAKVVASESFTVGTTEFQNCASATLGSVSKSSNCVRISVVKSTTPTTGFTVDKAVRLVGGNTVFYDSVSAIKGGLVEFRIRVTNTGNTDATNVVIKDVLPAHLTYGGSGKLVNKDALQGVAFDATNLVQGGVTIPTIKAGTDNGFALYFTARVAESAACDMTQVNTASVIHASSTKAMDTASVFTSCQPGLHVVKDVKTTADYSDNGGQVVAGQGVWYRIRVYNSGTATVLKPYVKDVLPSGVQFVPGTLSIDGEKMLGQNESEFFSARGMLLTDFTPGMSKEILFQATIGACPATAVNLTNTAEVSADGGITKNDTAVVKQVACGSTPQPPLPKTGPGATAVALLGLASTVTVGKRALQQRAALRSATTKLEVL